MFIDRIARRNRFCAAERIISTCLVLMALPLLASAESTSKLPRHVTQTGVIEINGCLVHPRDLLVTASPIVLQGVQGPSVFATSGEDNDKDADDAPARKAEIKRTRDPHIFEVTLHNLRLLTGYSLNAQLRQPMCGQVTWVGPKGGFFVPDPERSVRIQLFSLTTQIDVQTTDSLGNIKLVGADALSPTSATRSFRWHTDLPDGTQAELQIAVDRFPSGSETPESCANPSGLITRIPLTAVAGDNFTPPVDFNQLIFGVAPGPNPGGPPGVILTPTQKAILHGAPLYVRAVPLGPEHIYRCSLHRDGAVAITILSYLNSLIAPTIAQPSPSLLVSGDYRPAQPVTTSNNCVTVVHKHFLTPLEVQALVNGKEAVLDVIDGPLTAFLLGGFFATGGVNHNGTNGFIDVGHFLCWNNSESVLDDVGNFISGIVEGIAEIVDVIANLYNEIKEKIADVVAFVISQLPGVTCDRGSVCQDLVNEALDTALAAMGLPPSLPNFQELANQGLDYMEGEIADQTGLPKDAVDAIAQKVIETVSKNQGGDSGLPNWLTNDNMFRPSVVTLTVTRNASFTKLPDALGIHTSPGNLYPDIIVPLPSRLDPVGATLTIPVQLPPDLRNTVNLPPSPFCGDQSPNGCRPPSLVLLLKLSDWYENHFTKSCSQLNITALTTHGVLEILLPPTLEDLGTHEVSNRAVTTFSPGNTATLCPN